MLNMERLKNLRDLIADENTFFDMGTFYVRKEQYNLDPDYKNDKYGIFPENACESPACVCGWLNHMAFHDKTWDYGHSKIYFSDMDEAIKYLGFDTDGDESNYLCSLFDASFLSREQVINILDMYITEKDITYPFSLIEVDEDEYAW